MRLSSKLVLVLGVTVSAAALLAWRYRGSADEADLAASIERGPIRVSLIENGRLRSADSMTYRSPVEGRELEITFLAPEGIQVAEGDLIVRLDSSTLRRELERAEQEHSQAQLEERMAIGELREAEAALDALGNGETSLEVEEATVALRLAERREERARREHRELEPLLASGYITRDELERAALELEQTAAAARLARRRLDAVQREAGPRARQRAELRLSQQRARVAHAGQQVRTAAQQVAQLHSAIAACSIFAAGPGLILHEEHLGATPRRKVRVGDRVTASYPIVTIPDVRRMVVDSSVREVDVHRVSRGQPVAIRMDAFPDAVIQGSVAAIGALARGSVDQPFEGRRFDVLVELGPTPIDLRPEMTARLEIQLAQRADALRIPINAVFDGPDGDKIALVLRKDRVEPRVLKLGLMDDLYYEVISGLEGGERVRLNNRAMVGALIDGAPPADDTARAR